jgi:hypothetical protein
LTYHESLDVTSPCAPRAHTRPALALEDEFYRTPFGV